MRSIRSTSRLSVGTPQIVLYGAGDTGLEIAEMIESTHSFTIAGFLDDFKDGQLDQYAILGTGAQLPEIRDAGIEFLAITISRNIGTRMKLAEAALRMGFRLPRLLHPYSIVSRKSVIEEGVIILGFASVAPGAYLGRMSLLKPHSRVAHGATVGDASLLAPYAYVGSHARVGKRNILDTRSSIQSGCKIGNDCIVCPNAYIKSSFTSFLVLSGSPASPVRRKSKQSPKRGRREDIYQERVS